MAEVLTAGEALVSSGIDPAAVRRELPTVEPYAVRIRVAPRWFRRMWASRIAAVTLPWAVYVTEPVFARLRQGAEPERMGPLVVHELTHHSQYATRGFVVALVHYAADYLRGRLNHLGHWAAYRNVRLEVEARKVAARFTNESGPR